MWRKEKEEDGMERIIRGLLKLPENRRCINCNSLGPQYVCTTFLTFVCANCSGIHREFTHRVKSVSMAKFTADEVSAIQAAGNERAKQIYFKEWDPKHNSYPDGRYPHRLRDFIKHVYVDRKYTGERGNDKLPRLRLGDREEAQENRKVSLQPGGSRSPSNSDRYESRSDDRTLRYYYDERRSPRSRYSWENTRYGGFKRSPLRIEVVDYRFRDDGPRGGSRGFSERDSSSETNSNGPTSPAVRPLKELVGENAPPLHVGENSKATELKKADDSSDQNLKSSNASVVTPKSQETSTSTNGIEHSSNKSSTKEDIAKPVPTPAPKKLTTLEFLLSELSVPSAPTSSNIPEFLINENCPASASVPTAASGNNIGMPVEVDVAAAPNNNVASTTVPAENMSVGDQPTTAQPTTVSTSSGPGGGPPATVQTFSLLDDFDASTTTSTATKPSNEDPPQYAPDTKNDTTSANEQLECSTQQDQDKTLVAGDGDTKTSTELVVAPLDSLKDGDTSLVINSHSNVVAAPDTTCSHPTEGVSKLVKDFTDMGIQPPVPETKSSGRKELPPDLFTVSYPLSSGTFPAWRSCPPNAMGFNMQYYQNAMVPAAYTPTTSTRNPFDINNEAAPVIHPEFPLMHNMQAALPTYPFRAPISPVFKHTDQNAYMAHQVVNVNMQHPRPQGDGFVASEVEDPFTSLNMPQLAVRGYSVQPTTTSHDSLPSRGSNPFE